MSFLNQLNSAMERNMKRAYFDVIQKDIQNQNFDSSFSLLEQIKERLCNIVPKRKDLHEQIEENIDISYFKQMVEHNALDNSIIRQIMNYVIDKIKDLGSTQDEPWNEIWRTQQHVKFERGDTLDKILPDFFREALHRIEKVESEIEAFKSSELYKMLMEQRERNNQ